MVCNNPHRGLWRDSRGLMVVSFALLIPLVAVVSMAILEFASAGLDYHRAGMALADKRRQLEDNNDAADAAHKSGHDRKRH